MRKWLWYGGLAGVAFTAGLFCSAWHVYTNPHSPMARCAAAGFQFSMRVNPLLSGFTTAAIDIPKLIDGGDSTTAQPPAPCFIEDAEPAEPTHLDELNGVTELPLQPVPAVVLDECDEVDRFSGLVITSKEPPLADGSHNEGLTITIYDPAVEQAVGKMPAVSAPSCRSMPYCKEDEETPAPCPSVGTAIGAASGAAIGGIVGADEDCGDDCWFSMCWKMFGGSCNSQDDHGWLASWFSYFCSPTVLEPKGDEELSEPKDMEDDPADEEEEPQPYHHTECPYSGACPYTGRMPSYTPPPAEPMNSGDEEQSEPMKEKKEIKMKIKLPSWWGGEIDVSDDKPVKTPGLDTMEFRPSDRTWNDYGPPDQL